MANCNVCDQRKGTRTIAGNRWCDECFSHLSELRADKLEGLRFFRDPENMKSASPSVKKYIDDLIEEKESILQEIVLEAQEKESKKVLIVNTPYLEGYEIEEYLEIISADIVVPNGLLGALTNGTFFTIDAMTLARTNALEKLKEMAISRGAGAVISVDIDISDLNGRGILVSANGTAVMIKRKTNAINEENAEALQ